jgi:Tol biopolymer transport system component
LENVALSPDGSKVVSVRADRQTGNFNLWEYDLIRHTDSRLTFTGSNRFPVWSPDGTQIAFDSSRDGARSVYRKSAVGNGKEELLERSVMLPKDWSRDGRYLLCDTPNQTPKTGNDIWALPLFGDHKPIPYVVTEFSELNPRLSPDGRWLAYQSSESGRPEIYVVSFPTPGGKWRISASDAAGAASPVWNRNGRELYFFSFDAKVMAVDIAPGPAFQAGIPKALFGVRMNRGNANIEVSQDGHFLLSVLPERPEAPIWVALNWPALLKK